MIVFGAPLVAVALLASPAPATPADSPLTGASAVCSNDAFAIDGSSVAVALCVPPDTATRSKPVVTVRVSVKGQAPLEHAVSLDRVPGADSSRAIDDVPLGALGLSRTLHLTIALRGGTVRLEHALMIPGAVALK